MVYKSGFTLVEITIILGILALLFSITSLSLSNTSPKNSLDGATQVLITNIKQQQLSALTGDTANQGSVSNYGLYFSAGKYTLFRGNSYNATDPANYDVVLDDINTSSSASGSVIIFSQNSGIIQNFVPSENTITLTQINVGISSTITINKYGIIESIL